MFSSSKDLPCAHVHTVGEESRTPVVLLLLLLMMIMIMMNVVDMTVTKQTLYPDIGIHYANVK